MPDIVITVAYLVCFAVFAAIAMTYGSLSTKEHPTYSQKSGRRLAFIYMILIGIVTVALGLM